MKNIVIILFLLVGILPCTAQELVWEIFPENTTGLGRIEFLPDGERFINNGNGQIQVRSLEDGRLLDSIVDPEGATGIFAFSDDESRFITITNGLQYKVYDSQSLEYLHQIKIPNIDWLDDSFGKVNYGGLADIHYSKKLSKIYMLQRTTIYKNEITNGRHWSNQYNTRFLVTDLTTEQVLYDTVFYSGGKSNANTYRDISLSYMAVNDNGTVIIDQKRSNTYRNSDDRRYFLGLHIYKDNITNYSFIEEPEINNGNTTTFFEVFDNGKKLLRVFDKAFSHPTLGDINFLIYDIESEKLVDGFQYQAPSNKFGAFFEKDSNLIIINNEMGIFNLFTKEKIYGRAGSINKSASSGRYKNKCLIFTYASIFKYEFDWETLATVETSSPEENKIVINPTPTSGVFELKLKELDIGLLKIDLYDISGSLLLNIYNNINNSNSFEKMVDISSLSNGTYLLRIENNGNILTKSILKGE